MGKKNQPKLRRRNREDSISEDEFDSLTITNQDWDSLSLIERLPVELLPKIFDYASEALFDLRLTSKLLRSRVDEYVCSAPKSSEKCQIVRELAFRKVSYKSRESFMGRIMIPKIYSNLFELRLELRQPQVNFNKRLKRVDHETSSGCLKEDFEYQFDFDSFFDDSVMLEYLRSCLGMQIGQATMTFEIECDQKEKTFVSKLYEGMQIEKLKVRSNDLPNIIGKRIAQFVEEHKVDQLWLHMRGCTSPDAIKNLHHFSSLVRSMKIEHNYSYYSQPLFHDRTVNWAPTIVDMFKRKMDKLEIFDDTTEGYFSDESAAELVARLPYLDKPIWLSVLFGRLDRRKVIMNKDEVNDTVIETNEITQNKGYRQLKIKHSSRLKEKF